MRHPIIQRIATSVKTFFVKKFTGIAGIGNLGVGSKNGFWVRSPAILRRDDYDGGGGVVSGFLLLSESGFSGLKDWQDRERGSEEGFMGAFMVDFRIT